MHVVLVGPELEENLSLRYLRGALEAEGHCVSQADFDGPQDLERVAAMIARSGADLAGFSMVFTRRAREFADLVTHCRELGYRGLTVAGGHFAAFHAERLLHEVPAIDAVAIGEGERILCDLARAPANLGQVAGLVWRDGGELRRNEPAQPPQNLDELAWPVHRRPFDQYLGLPIANLLGSRGCTYACGFCSIAAWHALCGGARYRQRSAGDVAAEMGCLWREGVRLFNFHDDNFLGRDRSKNLERAVGLRDALARQGVGKLGFQIKARPDAVDPELFALLKSMGLFRVFLGIEAGTDASLRNLGRGQRLTDNEHALDVLNGLDLHVAFNLLILNPESTFDDLAGNVAFLRAHARNPLNFCRTEIYAGTPIERRLRKAGRLFGDDWGLDYAIEDRRAQLAFDLFRDAFFDRNFGDHPLHYLSGQVDYEHQVRADFFGTSPELRSLAKGFVRHVNENTVTHLERVLDAVRSDAVDDSFAAELTARVAADDVRLHAEGQVVLTRIRELSPIARRSGRSKAALAASVALAMAGCTEPGTRMMEAAPEPPDVHRQSETGPDAGGGTQGEVLVVVPADAGATDPTDAGATPVQDASAPTTLPTATATQVREAAPPPPPHVREAAPPPPTRTPPAHMEAAPRWDPGDPRNR